MTGKLEYKRVSALTPQHMDKLLEVQVDGEAGPLRPSIDHPFWVKRGKGAPEWIEADKINEGDLVQTINGKWRHVLAILPLAGLQTVYNFEVDDDHDYFVGSVGILVHNSYCGLGTQVHQTFNDVLPEIENIDDSENLAFNTAPGETGPDAQWDPSGGPSPLPGGADSAELKPAGFSNEALAGQISNWIDKGIVGSGSGTALYYYNQFGIIGFSGWIWY